MDIKEDVYIVPLTKLHLKETIELLNSVFTDEDEIISKEIEASLDKKKLNEYDEDIRSLEYFIATNRDKKVIGVIGLYLTAEDYNDSYWIGWYCVRKNARGRGIGTILMNFAINEAKIRGKKYLKLYTSNDKNEKEAQKIYDRNGFFITKIEDKEDYKIIYRKKVL